MTASRGPGWALAVFLALATAAPSAARAAFELRDASPRRWAPPPPTERWRRSSPRARCPASRRRANPRAAAGDRVALGRRPFGDLSNRRSRDEPTGGERRPVRVGTVARMERAHGSGRARVERAAHAVPARGARAFAARGDGTTGLRRGRGAAPRGWTASFGAGGSFPIGALRARFGFAGDRLLRSPALDRERVPSSVGFGAGLEAGGAALAFADLWEAAGREARDSRSICRCRCRARAPRAGWIAGKGRRGGARPRRAVGNLGRSARLRGGNERLGRDDRTARPKRRAARPRADRPSPSPDRRGDRSAQQNQLLRVLESAGGLSR